MSADCGGGCIRYFPATSTSPAVPASLQAVSRPQLRCAYEASAPVWEAAEALEGDRAALAELQARHGVDCPLELDLRLAGGRRQTARLHHVCPVR